MKYYRTWQEALQDFIARFGDDYESGYNLIEEFEQKLNKNSNGAYFMYIRRVE